MVLRSLSLFLGVAAFPVVPYAGYCWYVLKFRTEIPGYMELRFSDGPARLVSIERHFTDASGRRLVLIPMCHVGEPAFYRAVQAVMAHAGVVNLLEGCGVPTSTLTINDQRRSGSAPIGIICAGGGCARGSVAPTVRCTTKAFSLVDTFQQNTSALPVALDQEHDRPGSYALMAERLGLTAQDRIRLGNAHNSICADNAEVLRQTMLRGAQIAVSGGGMQHRNETLLWTIRSARHRFPHKSVVVPWGAAHMPYVHSHLILSEGLTEDTSKRKERTVMSFYSLCRVIWYDPSRWRQRA